MDVTPATLPAVDQQLIARAQEIAAQTPASTGARYYHTVLLEDSPVEGLAAEVSLSRAQPDHDWTLNHVVVFGDRADGGPEQFIFSADGTKVTPAFWIYPDAAESCSPAGELLTTTYLTRPADVLHQVRTRVAEVVEADPYGDPSLATLRAAIPDAPR